MINEFLENKVNSESAKKSYNALFRRIGEYEKHYNKKINKWNKEDCLNFLGNLGSKKYNTIAVKWSLLKKYLFYIGNNVYREITNDDLKYIEDKAIKYVSWDKLFNSIDIFENNLDKSLLLLLRSGIKGEEYCELSNLKKKDIKDNFIQLPNRRVEMNDRVKEVVQKAVKELGYRMNVKESIEQGKRIAYSYYRYNDESEYFWRNRPNKFNHQGLDAMKANAAKTKINNLISRIENEDISATSLIVSYAVDEIVKIEKQLGIKFSEKQTKSYIETLGIKCSMYTVFVLKNEM